MGALRQLTPLVAALGLLYNEPECSAESFPSIPKGLEIAGRNIYDYAEHCEDKSQVADPAHCATLLHFIDTHFPTEASSSQPLPPVVTADLGVAQLGFYQTTRPGAGGSSGGTSSPVASVNGATPKGMPKRGESSNKFKSNTSWYRRPGSTAMTFKVSVTSNDVVTLDCTVQASGVMWSSGSTNPMAATQHPFSNSQHIVLFPGATQSAEWSGVIPTPDQHVSCASM